ncbi:opacity protein-like surface antigen [Marinobacter sp. MBR-99]|jgi:opacity protein-like surface antigen|uniref:outer membrane beta-barrel protein n=1 Tax=Marinobacter sp. MBR-99 TaxID=3156461 RepID=UPI0033918941
MNKVALRFLSSSLMAISLAPLAAQAQDTPRSDKHYIGLLVTALEHRSIGDRTKEDAWGQAGTLVIGGHLNDLIHAEIRLGGGFNDADVSGGDLTLAVDYFASWYMGLHYPITDYANVYAQAGFTHVKGEATLANREEGYNAQFRDIEGDYPDSSFSISWLAGVDFEVLDNTFLVFEGGRLFKDTGSSANTFQFSTGLRYEF